MQVEYSCLGISKMSYQNQHGPVATAVLFDIPRFHSVQSILLSVKCLDKEDFIFAYTKSLKL